MFARVMLVTHSSSLLIVFGSDWRQRCRGSMFRVTKGMMGAYQSPSSFRQKYNSHSALQILSLAASITHSLITAAVFLFRFYIPNTHTFTAFYVLKAEPKLLRCFFCKDATYSLISAVQHQQETIL